MCKIVLQLRKLQNFIVMILKLLMTRDITNCLGRILLTMPISVDFPDKQDEEIEKGRN